MSDHAVIGYIHPDYVRAEFMSSMLALLHSGRTVVDSIITVKCGPNIATGRNDTVSKFLNEGKAPWLWMVDTDMVFAPDTLDRLIAAADANERPIMGALCYSQGADGEQWSTAYELVDQGDGPVFVRYQVWPDDQPFKVSATGTGCLLIHRQAFLKVASGFGDKVDRVWPWFRESTLGTRAMGEDLTFCLRAQTAGIPIYVHSGIQVGHMKSTMLGKVV